MNESTNVLQRMRDSRFNHQTVRTRQRSVQRLMKSLRHFKMSAAQRGNDLVWWLPSVEWFIYEASFQIGSSSGEVMIYGLTSVRADDFRMGGTTFDSENGSIKSWEVPPTASDLSLNSEPKQVKTSF